MRFNNIHAFALVNGLLVGLAIRWGFHAASPLEVDVQSPEVVTKRIVPVSSAAKIANANSDRSRHLAHDTQGVGLAALPKLYPIEQWQKFPAEWLTQSHAINFTVGLRGGDEESHLDSKLVTALRLSDPERRLIENRIRDSMNQWVMLAAREVKPINQQTWKISSSPERRAFFARFDDSIYQLLGAERHAIFRLLAVRELDFYFGDHPVTLSTDEAGLLKMTAENFGAKVTKNIHLEDHKSSTDPWYSLFRATGIAK